MEGWVGGARAHFLSPWGPVRPSLAPALGGGGVTWPQPCILISGASKRVQFLLVPVCLDMATLLLLLGVLVVSPEVLGNMTAVQTPTPGGSSAPLVLTSEGLSLNSTVDITLISDPKDDGTRDQTSAPPPVTSVNEGSPVGTSIGASTGFAVPEPMTLEKVSFNNSSVLLETTSATSHPPAPTTASSLGSHTVTDETVTTNFPETPSGTRGPSLAMATSSLETSSGATGSLVTKPTGSLESSSDTFGSLVTMVASSLETAAGTTRPPVTTAAASLEPSSWASEPQVSSVKLSTMMTPTTPTNASTGSFLHPDEDSRGMLLVAVLAALLVVMVLVALLLLWRRRQKRRTGALVLSGGGKRNGVVDAWAGPAQVPEEGAMTVTVGGSGGNKGSGVPDGGESGQRPTLTTFFGRRKSRQGSLVMEELKSGSGPSLKGEEEPLVGGEDGAVDAPAPDEPEAGDGAAR
ncbi:leukosialin isoform X2 [Sapajus apella]|uniref:Leukosialin isoform X2 n=1 Tax=Sapajus apella TaxID=9515 RepID=A0A6J3F0G5_SAPAP|nr:leukosialin isoform X2 [Sapajus apella]